MQKNKLIIRFLNLLNLENLVRPLIGAALITGITSLLGIVKYTSYLSITLSGLIAGLLVYLILFTFKYVSYRKGLALSGLYTWNGHKDEDSVKRTEKWLVEELNEANEIDILFTSGFNTFRAGHPFYESIKASSAKKIRLLVIDPACVGICESRLTQVNWGAKEDKQMTLEDFVQETKTTLQLIKELQKENKRIYYETYREVPVWRIVRADYNVYVQPYLKDRWSWKSTCFGFSFVSRYNFWRSRGTWNPNSLFLPFQNHFESLFERAVAANKERMEVQCVPGQNGLEDKRLDLRDLTFESITLERKNGDKCEGHLVDHSPKGVGVGVIANVSFEKDEAVRVLANGSLSQNRSAQIVWSRSIFENKYRLGLELIN